MIVIMPDRSGSLIGPEQAASVFYGIMLRVNLGCVFFHQQCSGFALFCLRAIIVTVAVSEISCPNQNPNYCRLETETIRFGIIIDYVQMWFWNWVMPSGPE